MNSDLAPKFEDLTSTMIFTKKNLTETGAISSENTLDNTGT